MTGPETRSPRVDNPDATRDEWLTNLYELLAQVRRWTEGSGWRTRVIEKSMKDSVLGQYKAPAMLMQRETVEVILDPVGRFAPGTDGVVDLYLLPAYDDIASLYFVDGAWKLHYAFRSTAVLARIKQAESMTLDEVSLSRVLNEIAAHAAVEGAVAEAAKVLAWKHYELEEGLTHIFRITDRTVATVTRWAPIKLLEVNTNTSESGIMPLQFGPAPACGVPYASVIVEVSPSEFQKLQSNELKLPEGWSIGEEFPRPTDGGGR